MNLTLHIWRQSSPKSKGRFETYKAMDVNEHMSFLEMLDVVNEQLEGEGKEPITFEHDCREGICGACGFVINGEPHGHRPQTTICQLHMREFKDGEELVLEPFRSKAFPVLKDLMVDRAAFVVAGVRDRRQHIETISRRRPTSLPEKTENGGGH